MNANKPARRRVADINDGLPEDPEISAIDDEEVAFDPTLSDGPIDKILPALAQAINSMTGIAVRDAANSHFRSRYATLASVFEACRKPLLDNGLIILQTAHTDMKTDTLYVLTRLIHTASGQMLCTGHDLRVSMEGYATQQIGSAITYLRRYQVMSLLWLVADDDDDDGERSMQPQRSEATARPQNEGPSRLPIDFKPFWAELNRIKREGSPVPVTDENARITASRIGKAQFGPIDTPENQKKAVQAGIIALRTLAGLTMADEAEQEGVF